MLGRSFIFSILRQLMNKCGTGLQVRRRSIPFFKVRFIPSSRALPGLQPGVTSLQRPAQAG